MITYKRPTTIGQKQTKDTIVKSKVFQGLVSTAYFVVAMENATNPWYNVFHK